MLDTKQLADTLSGTTKVMTTLLGAVAAVMHNPGINLLSFVFSAGIGVLFGYFPARRAARLDPIEALRHE